jgi:hypothetical protein
VKLDVRTIGSETEIDAIDGMQDSDISMRGVLFGRIVALVAFVRGRRKKDRIVVLWGDRWRGGSRNSG